MGSRVMDIQDISHLNLRQHPIDCKLIIVLAKGSRYIILMVTGGIFLTHNRNMMISPVHSRSHKVNGAGIAANVLLVGMLLSDGRGNKGPVRSHHETAQLRINSHIRKPCRSEDLIINLVHRISDYPDIVLRLLRSIIYSYTTGQVNKLQFHTGLFYQLHSRLK